MRPDVVWLVKTRSGGKAQKRRETEAQRCLAVSARHDSQCLDDAPELGHGGSGHLCVFAACLLVQRLQLSSRDAAGSADGIAYLWPAQGQVAWREVSKRLRDTTADVLDVVVDGAAFILSAGDTGAWAS